MSIPWINSLLKKPSPIVLALIFGLMALNTLLGVLYYTFSDAKCQGRILKIQKNRLHVEVDIPGAGRAVLVSVSSPHYNSDYNAGDKMGVKYMLKYPYLAKYFDTIADDDIFYHDHRNSLVLLTLLFILSLSALVFDFSTFKPSKSVSQLIGTILSALTIFVVSLLTLLPIYFITTYHLCNENTMGRVTKIHESNIYVEYPVESLSKIYKCDQQYMNIISGPYEVGQLVPVRYLHIANGNNNFVRGWINDNTLFYEIAGPYTILFLGIGFAFLPTLRESLNYIKRSFLRLPLPE